MTTKGKENDPNCIKQCCSVASENKQDRRMNKLTFLGPKFLKTPIRLNHV